MQRTWAVNSPFSPQETAAVPWPAIIIYVSCPVPSTPDSCLCLRADKKPNSRSLYLYAPLRHWSKTRLSLTTISTRSFTVFIFLLCYAALLCVENTWAALLNVGRGYSAGVQGFKDIHEVSSKQWYHNDIHSCCEIVTVSIVPVTSSQLQFRKKVGIVTAFDSATIWLPESDTQWIETDVPTSAHVILQGRRWRQKQRSQIS